MRRIVRAAAVAAALLFAPEAGAQMRLELNIPEQLLHLYRGGERIRSYQVSVGEPGYETPDGEFQISHAEWNPSWKPPASEWAKDRKFTPPGPNNPMGRVKLFFMPLYFLHGTPEEQKIGTPASRGCVRLRNRDIVELARLLHEEVAPHVPAAEIDRILAKSSHTRAVRFRSPVSLSIRYDRYRVRGDSVVLYPDFYRRAEGVHAEGVRQALMEAGFGLHHVGPEEIGSFLAALRATEATRTLSLREFFPLLTARRVRADVVPPTRPRHEIVGRVVLRGASEDTGEESRGEADPARE